MTRLSQPKLIALLTFVGGVGGGLVFPIVPALGLELGLSGFVIGLVLSANRVSRLIFNIVAGSVFARIGARRTLLGAFAIITLGMILLNVALLTETPGLWLFVARFVNGIGLAFLLIGAQASLLGGANRAERGRRAGLFRTAFNASLPGGLILGGILADFYSDATAFWAGTFVSCLGFFLAFFIAPVKATPKTDLPHEKPGYRALLTGPHRATLLSAAFFNFLVFLTVQGALLATLVVLVSEREINFYRFEAQGTASIAMAMMVTMAAVFSIPFGRLLDRMELRTTLLVPSVFGMGVGFYCLAEAQGMGLLFLGAAILGLTHNFVTVVAMALIGDGAPEGQPSQAVALFQSAGDIGGTAGPILALVIATRIGVDTLYVAMAAMLVTSVLVVLWARQHEAHAVVAAQR